MTQITYWMAFTQSFQSQTVQTIALATENVSTTLVFAKTIGEVKIAPELSVQIIVVTLVFVGRKDANATLDTLDNLAHCIKVIRRGIGMLFQNCMR